MCALMEMYNRNIIRDAKISIFYKHSRQFDVKIHSCEASL